MVLLPDIAPVWNHLLFGSRIAWYRLGETEMWSRSRDPAPSAWLLQIRPVPRVVSNFSWPKSAWRCGFIHRFASRPVCKEDQSRLASA